MNKIEQVIASAILDNEIVALRFAATQERAVDAKLKALRESAKWILAQAKLENKTGQQEAIRSFKAVSKEVFEELTQEQMSDLREFMALTSEATVSVINGAVAVDLFKQVNRLSANVEAMIIDGTPASEWWSRQAEGTQRAFAREIRTGFVSGETTDEIARRIIGRRGQPGILDVSLRQARSLAHSSVMTAANLSVDEILQENDDLVNGFYWVSTLDSRTCAYCGPRDQLKYTLDHRPVGHKLPWGAGPGAAHIGCRCARSPWVKSWRELGVDVDDFNNPTRASMDGPVDGDLTFEKWIESKPAQVQREWFGPGRYELYRDGKITLRDLTNMRGRELTLEQLRERYA